MLPKGKMKAWDVGMSNEFRTIKNRYANIAAYDHTRVVLKNTEDHYINANFIEVRTFWLNH
jgi:protein tyrosine phosphatase